MSWRRGLVLAVAGALMLGSCSSPQAGVEGFSVGDGTYTSIRPSERVAAPVLSGETLEGVELSTSQFSGRVLVVNVWGSWCAPCRKEAPELVEAAKRRPKVAFVGVDTRDPDPAPAKAFVRAFEVGYPNLYDPDGRLLLGFADLPPKAVPSTIVVDAKGRLAARVLGATSATTLIGILDDVTAGR